MPRTATKALSYLGYTATPTGDDLAWGKLAPGTQIAKAEALFPRIDEKNEI
jgi:methionyl-tRNA synthetase